MAKRGRPIAPLSPRNRLQRKMGAKSNKHWIVLGEAYKAIIENCYRDKWLKATPHAQHNFPFWIHTDDQEGIEINYPGIEKRRRGPINSPYIYDGVIVDKNGKKRIISNIKGRRDARAFSAFAATLAKELRDGVEKLEIKCAIVQKGHFIPIEDQASVFWAQQEREVFYSGRILMPSKKFSRLLALDRADFDAWLTKFGQRQSHVNGYPHRYKPTMNATVEAFVQKVCEQMPPTGADLLKSEWQELLNHFLARYEIAISESAMRHTVSPQIISKIDPYRLAGIQHRKSKESRAQVEPFIARITHMIDQNDPAIIPGGDPAPEAE